MNGYGRPPFQQQQQQPFPGFRPGYQQPMHQQQQPGYRPSPTMMHQQPLPRPAFSPAQRPQQLPPQAFAPRPGMVPPGARPPAPQPINGTPFQQQPQQQRPPQSPMTNTMPPRPLAGPGQPPSPMRPPMGYQQAGPLPTPGMAPSPQGIQPSPQAAGLPPMQQPPQPSPMQQPQQQQQQQQQQNPVQPQPGLQQPGQQQPLVQQQTPIASANQATTPEQQQPDQQQQQGDQAHQQRRKRMYPKQVFMEDTNASGNFAAPVSAAATPAYPQMQQPQQLQQPQQPQQPQFMSPMGAAPTYPGSQQPAQQPAAHPQAIQSMTNQMGQMNLGGAPAQPMPSVSLMGAPPPVNELVNLCPPIRLPQNVSITNSPFANCDESYKCCTVNAIPNTEALLKKSRLPFALVLAPYRSLDDNEEPVPVVSDSVISRCRRCRTYINPFVTFVEGGQRWKCNMCFLLNDVPAAFDYDAHSQKQTDRWKRPELNYGTVEFVAPTEYMVRPPQAPAFVFVLDVSYSAVQSGMLATAARTLLDTLERIPNDENRTSIGIITVDSALHFYNFDDSLEDPQMLVVADVEDIDAVKVLLEKLPDMFRDTTNVNNALGPALQAAHKMLAPYGGKIICLQSTLPNIGTGALKSREDVKLLGTPKESTLLNPASPFYKSFAVDCSRSQIACDMLIFGGQYADVATLSCLPHYTGGQTYYYPGFNASRTEDALKFAHEFSELLSEQIGLEAVIRIRASRGLRMNAFHGNFFIRSTDLLALPNVPRDQNYCVEVVIEDDLKTPTVCFQTALLHTSCTGERRIRVVTLCLPVSNSIPELYANINPKAMISYLANKAVERALSSKLDDARDAVVNKLVDLLGVYKAHVLGSAQGSTPQLTIPENLKLLPLLALALIKHDGLRQSSQIPTDMRANAMNLLRTMPLQLLIPYLHANFYSLHNMPPEAGELTEQGLVFPPVLNLTAERIEAHGCYLLENGQHIYLWVGRGVVPQLCMDLFDAANYEALRGGKYTLPVLDTPLNRKVNLLIGKIREMRRGDYYPTLYLVKEDGDPYLKIWFLSHLIEDRTENVMSYQQFLQFIKDRVGSGSF
ncbi:hypothetical protein DM01DRAFT_1337773 [Hesseltinella vesiculosa]|uniref:Beta-sandwich domain of Sec23/24 n=1 Tax=Hesseltinella vesiculosa TaxID=101127 RepID=A0A1X2GBM6_9FUNG|nr:hypothetical protein DM01DRAFT_1337773 [Hesseltinella vesiculosa]